MANAGYEVSVASIDVSSREAIQALVAKATGLGAVTGLIHAAGVSPSQASPATILKVDLYGAALVVQAFGNVIANGGGGCRDCLAIRPSTATTECRTEQGAGDDCGGRLAEPAISAARGSERLVACVSTVEARQLSSCDGRSGALGQARCTHQHDQPRHHHDSACKR